MMNHMMDKKMQGDDVQLKDIWYGQRLICRGPTRHIGKDMSARNGDTGRTMWKIHAQG